MVWLFLLFGSVRFPSPAQLSPLCRKSYPHPLPPLERSSSPSSLLVRLLDWRGPERHGSPSLHRSKASLRNIRVILALSYRRGWCTRGAWKECMRTGEPRFVIYFSGLDLNRTRKPDEQMRSDSFYIPNKQ